jgi:hypothetical protein
MVTLTYEKFKYDLTLLARRIGAPTSWLSSFQFFLVGVTLNQSEKKKIPPPPILRQFRQLRIFLKLKKIVFFLSPTVLLRDIQLTLVQRF